jgi:hypothetical protein
MMQPSGRFHGYFDFIIDLKKQKPNDFATCCCAFFILPFRNEIATVKLDVEFVLYNSLALQTTF